MLRQMQPLVLIGMHRSGTSLSVRLLTELGIHMGSWLSRDAESVHFQRLNRRIFAAAGSKWGSVDALVEAMRSDGFVESQTEATRRGLFEGAPFPGRRSVIAGFFGSDLWRQVLASKPVVWGWKDPRTTLAIPVWTRIFPRARWVHVLRNGIDVAISTHRRSKKQQRKLRNRLFPLDYSPRTLDFGYSFRLWEAYVSFAFEYKDLIPPEQYLEVRYEDLLAEPEIQLRRILDHFLEGSVHHPIEDDRLSAACRLIDQSRLDNSRFAAGYREEIPTLAASPLMQELGYSYSSPQDLLPG